MGGAGAGVYGAGKRWSWDCQGLRYENMREVKREVRRKERAVQFINLSQLEALYARYSIS
jgi:hypothetical protein